MAVAAVPARILSTLPKSPPRLGREPRRPGLKVPRLSVVIVNYCLWEETEELVRQLRAAECTKRGDVEVIVVDNHSTYHPLARKIRRWPEVALRRWGRNRGFARAVNEGYRLSCGEWLLMLNPDIRLNQEFLDGALSLAEELTRKEPSTGVIGFRLRNVDGSPQLSAGPFPTLFGTLARLALPRHRRKYYAFQPEERGQVPWVTGCCALLRRGCLQDLGGLDDDFFLYYEDVDLCQRAQTRGWSVVYEPGLSVTHVHPLHLRAVPAYLRVLTRHALLTYARKHWPRWQTRVLAAIVELEARFRGHWATRLGQHEQASLFGQLRRIASDLGRGASHSARQRLERLIRHEELARVA